MSERIITNYCKRLAYITQYKQLVLDVMLFRNTIVEFVVNMQNNMSCDEKLHCAIPISLNAASRNYSVNTTSII